MLNRLICTYTRYAKVKFIVCVLNYFTKNTSSIVKILEITVK